MDVTALVPALTIEAQGVENAQGQLTAKKTSFTPDELAVVVAEEQQILTNQAVAAKAQTTANQGVRDAKLAQTSSDPAQAAGAAAVMDAAVAQLVNRHVSGLDNYNTVAEAVMYSRKGWGLLWMTRRMPSLRFWRHIPTEELGVT